jgi:hypothetical protein
MVRIYPFSVSRNRLERAIESLKVSAVVARHWDDADVIVTLKGHDRRDSERLKEKAMQNVKIHVVKSNTTSQLTNFLRELFHLPVVDLEELAVREAEDAARMVLRYSRPVELAPQASYIRRKQHEVIEKYRLKSKSMGAEPNRRIKIYRD